MKTERNILIAFLLNLGFSVFEFFGGVFTGSVAILSDAVHDLGDALGIAVDAGVVSHDVTKAFDEGGEVGHGGSFN